MMIRLFKIALFVLAVGLFAGPVSAEAAIRISPNNPYKSFSISGINYGSMQWEREHGNSNYTPRSNRSGWGRRGR